MKRSLVLPATFLLSVIAASAQVTIDLPPFEGPADVKVAAVTATVTNATDFDQKNVSVTASLFALPAMILAGASDDIWSCHDAGTLQSVVCTAAILRARQSVPLTLFVDQVAVGRFALNISPPSPPGSRGVTRVMTFYRRVPVTNTKDAGEGSFRQALLDANAVCARTVVPCAIDFQIAEPVPDSGWYTISPATPLPLISADLIIDGATQIATSGDTNPDGPEIMLDGSRTQSGNGLEFVARAVMRVHHLSIGGFRGNGIRAAIHRNGDDPVVTARIEENYIGVDPSGRNAAANGSRGITIDGPTAYVEIARNVLSGNGRSGVFITGDYAVDVVDNRIGVDIDGHAMPNRASGIFVGPEARAVNILRNRIAWNGDFGVAISRPAYDVIVRQNSMARNRISAIDVGLDGFSGYAYDDIDPHNTRVPPPRFISATYDAATDATTIIGTYFDAYDHWGEWEISLFSNDFPEAQGDIFLGTATAKDGLFTFTASGDLRGRYITATGHRHLALGFSGEYFFTSEFAEIIEVR
jgi:hypothetical protein